MKAIFPKDYILALIMLLALVLSSACLYRFLYKYQMALITSEEDRFNSYILATQLRRSSDELTRLVRTYAVTGNPRFADQFRQVLAIRNGESPLPEHYDRVYWDFLAVENSNPPFASSGKSVSLQNQMMWPGITEEEVVLLKQSQSNSDRLVNLEQVALNAMIGLYQDELGEFSISAEPNRQMAIDILHSEEYHQAKISIMTPLNQFYEILDKRTQKNVKNSADHLAFTLNLQVVVFVLSLGTIAVLLFTVRHYHKTIVNDLNRMVDERTGELERSNLELQKALDEIKTIRGIIPICSYCHSIRNNEGAWDRMEAYISKNTEASFSHGICPKCMTKVFPEHSGGSKP